MHNWWSVVSTGRLHPRFVGILGIVGKTVKIIIFFNNIYKNNIFMASLHAVPTLPLLNTT